MNIGLFIMNIIISFFGSVFLVLAISKFIKIIKRKKQYVSVKGLCVRREEEYVNEKSLLSEDSVDIKHNILTYKFIDENGNNKTLNINTLLNREVGSKAKLLYDKKENIIIYDDVSFIKNLIIGIVGIGLIVISFLNY